METRNQFYPVAARVEAMKLHCLKGTIPVIFPALLHFFRYARHVKMHWTAAFLIFPIDGINIPPPVGKLTPGRVISLHKCLSLVIYPSCSAGHHGLDAANLSNMKALNHTGYGELKKFHVHQWSADLESKGIAVSGKLIDTSGIFVNTRRTAGCQYDRLSSYGIGIVSPDIDSKSANHSLVFCEQPGHHYAFQNFYLTVENLFPNRLHHNLASPYGSKAGRSWIGKGHGFVGRIFALRCSRVADSQRFSFQHPVQRFDIEDLRMFLDIQVLPTLDTVS